MTAEGFECKPRRSGRRPGGKVTSTAECREVGSPTLAWLVEIVADGGRGGPLSPFFKQCLSPDSVA